MRRILMLLSVILWLAAYCLPARAQSPPANPTGLTAAGSNNQVVLTWVAPAGPVASYTVYRSYVSGGVGVQKTTKGITTTTFTDTSVVNGTAYYYHVTATNSNGESSQATSPGLTITPPNSPPATPAGLTATAGDNQVTLSWTEPAGPAPTSYKILRGTSSGNETNLNAAASTSFTDTTAANGTTYYYEVSALVAGGGSSSSNEAFATPYSSPPSVATAAAASPNPVASGKTTALSVLGASQGGESGLTYTWTATGSASVTYSANGTNAAKTTTATFTKAGAYSFTAKITDNQGGSVTSSVSVTVNQALTSIAVSPASASVATGATQQFAATANDQFGTVLTTQPTFTWTVSGGGTISGGGLFTAGTTAGGPFTVKAASGSVSGTASVTVTSGTISVPQNLVALPEYNAVALYWQIAYGTSYNVYRASVSCGPYTLLTTNPITVATYTDTSVTNGNTYYYVITAVVSGVQSGYSNEASAVPGAIPPSDLAAYTTGSGKISLYWSRVPNATGYNIYRGTTTGGENYAAPINGATPVNTASYTGSNLDIYTNTGLTNGTDYFYTVKAVYSSGMSAPSTEDTDTPDPSAVPWDSRNPSSILAAFRSVFASDISNQGTGSYQLRVVGPDNSIYDASYSTVQPPDGTYSPGTYQFTQSDGVTTSLPDDLGQYDVPLSGMSPQLVGSILPASNGPYRRVRTTQLYRGEAGIVDLPTPILSDPRAAQHDDTAMIFFGGSGNSLEVDAGLQYSTTYGMWEMFMNINHKYVGTKQNPAVPLFNHPHDFVNTPPGSGPTVAYWAWGNFPSTNRAKLSLLLVDDSIDGNDAGAIGAPSRYLGKTENIRAKRVHAIAQKTQGVFPTASVMDNAGWQQGYVALPDDAGSEVGWSASDGVSTSEDGSYDGGRSTVIANELSKYITEIGIDIIMDGS